jgi:hypothetical protein
MFDFDAISALFAVVAVVPFVCVVLVKHVEHTLALDTRSCVCDVHVYSGLFRLRAIPDASA